MPALRKFLRNPASYLGVIVLLIVMVLLDGLHAPEAQLTARAYIAAVHSYQQVGHPLLEGRVRCRFQPTCSNYSIAAVQRYGILRGLRLTAGRVWRCRSSVSSGTSDPVP